MALVGYSVERYRCFVERVDVSIRPLTLFFGRNAAGKSALARALPRLAASSATQSASPLDLLSPPARGASYDEIASRLTPRNALGFGVRWNSAQPCDFEVQLRDVPEQKRQIVESLRFDEGSGVLELT